MPRQGVYPGGSLGLPLPVVSDRCWIPNNQGIMLSDGTVTGQNSRVKHTIRANVWELRFVYANFISGGSSDTLAGCTPYTVRCAIESPSGTYTPLYFNGVRDIVVNPGAVVVTDPFSVYIAAGTAVWSRTFASVPGGSKWPQNLAVWGVDQGATSSVGETDKTTMTLGASTAWCLAPYAVIGLARPSVPPAVCGLGDSIMYGQGHSGVQATLTSGFFVKGLTDALAPYMVMAEASSRAATFTPATFVHRARFLSACPHVVCQLGTNDFNNGDSLSTVQASVTNLWNWAIDRGCKVYQTTLTPRTTGDQTTSGGQTPTAWEASRTAFNDWVRSRPAPLSGYIEIADVVEANAAGALTRNGGRWVANGATDGTHPTTASHVAMAAAMTAWHATLTPGYGITGGAISVRGT